MRDVRGGLGLAAQRIAFGPSTLVTSTPTHVAVRTPSRPSHEPANALHLYDQPEGDIGRWWDAFDRTVGILGGIAHERVSWQGDTAGVDLPGDDVEVTTTTAWRLDGESSSPPLPGDVQVFEVGDDDRLRSGARALLLQGGWGTDVDHFRWWTGQDQDIVVAGRGALWVAHRYGIPIARVGLFHDHAGLATLTALVRHPLYTGEQIGAALAGHAIDEHRRVHGMDTIVVTTQPDGPGATAAATLGFTRDATIVTATRH